MRRALPILLLVSLLGAPALAQERAQRNVRLCMTGASAALRQAFAVELRARGFAVSDGCADAAADGWVVRLDVPDPLGAVWIVATPPVEHERRARVDGPLDTLDEHALALTAASLLEEEVIPPPPATVVGSPGVGLASPDPAAVVVDGGATDPAATSDDASIASTSGHAVASTPPELVESSRAIGSVFFLELGGTLGLVTHEQGALGAVAGVGLHAAPWLRMRLPLLFQIWPDRFWELGTGLAIDLVISLSRSETWLELGGAFRVAARSTNQGSGWTDELSVGGSAHAGFFYAIDESWRLFARGEGIGLYGTASGEAGYGLYLTLGAAVIL
jgi:hypothetical protein